MLKDKNAVRAGGVALTRWQKIGEGGQAEKPLVPSRTAWSNRRVSAMRAPSHSTSASRVYRDPREQSLCAARMFHKYTFEEAALWNHPFPSSIAPFMP